MEQYILHVWAVFLKVRKDALSFYINDRVVVCGIDPIMPEEWKIIECCLELLKPFEESSHGN